MDIALIQFKEAGKKYYFKIPEHLKLNEGDKVILETTVGLEIGLVSSIKGEDELEVLDNLKPVVRLATKKDLEHEAKNQADEILVIDEASKLINKYDLDMFVLNAEYTLDRAKLTIYFKAEERVDFRDLVKDLSGLYQTRIELRQIGPRDVAKIVGGIGPCGLVLCCQSFIGEFDAVTIKMAKNQELSLNPKNISGVCGKLLCCLKFEDEVYGILKNEMPDLNQKVKSEKGEGRVIDINFISSKVKIKYFENDIIPEWVDYRELIK